MSETGITVGVTEDLTLSSVHETLPIVDQAQLDIENGAQQSGRDIVDGGQPDDTDSDDESDLSVLGPDHPLMKRVQEALKNQLLKKKEELRLLLDAQKEELKSSQKDREDVGVELYTVQQQLAKQQGTLEKLQDNVAELTEKRKQQERVLSETTHQHDTMTEHLTQQRQQEITRRRDYDSVSADLRRLEQALIASKSELAATKRAADKASSDIKKTEQDKIEQDLYVDWLTDKVRRLEETIAIQKSQKEAQNIQMKQVKEVYYEANTEFEVLRLEKKHILQQWNLALIGMQRRDEALSSVQQSRQDYQNQLNTMKTEMNSFKRSIKEAQEKNELLTGLLRHTEHDLAVLKKQLELNQQEQESLRLEYGTYTRMLHETEQQLQRTSTDKILKYNNLKAIRTQCERETLEKVKLEDTIMEKVMMQLTINKASQHTAKAIDQTRNNIKEIQSKATKIENNLATRDLELSRYTSRVKELQKLIETYNDQLKQQNEQVNLCELEMHKQNILIDRKQTQVDQLNKKIDKIISGREGAEEELGPLELSVKQLTKQVQASVEECQKLQQYWLREQSEMVRVVTAMQTQSANIDTLKKELLILNQKKLRLDKQVEQEKEEHSSFTKIMTNLRQDMSKLHSLLTNKKSEQEDLEQNNLLVENDFLHTLKDSELESVELQTKLDQIKEEKERLLNCIMESEEQIMLWERKIQLGRETKEALEKDFGEGEIQGMKAEIHRMHVRHDQLKRQQEKLIQDMEKAVYKREAIEKKGDAQLKSGKGETTGQLQLKIEDTKKRINQTQQRSNKADTQIKEIEAKQTVLGEKMEQKKTTCQELNEAVSNLELQLYEMNLEKQKNLLFIVGLQNRSKQIDSASKNKYSYVCKDSAKVDSEIDSQIARSQLLISIMDQMVEGHPQCLPEIHKVKENMQIRLQISKFIQETLQAIEK